MKYEFQELDEIELEKTRRCLLTIAHSKNQTHAGYLIAIIIGSLTLISQYDIFLSPSQKPNISIITLLFFFMISAIAFVTVYIIKRTFYWTTYGTQILSIPTVIVMKFFKEYESKPENKELRERLNPLTVILDCAVNQRLEHISTGKKEGKKTDEKVGLITKISVMNNTDTILMCLGVSLLVFDSLLMGFFA